LRNTGTGLALTLIIHNGLHHIEDKTSARPSEINVLFDAIQASQH